MRTLRTSRKWVGFTLVVVGLVVGCHSPPFLRHPVKYGSVPFGFGTNAAVQINANVKEGGSYHLYFVLQSAGVPRDQSGRLPSLLDNPVQVLVFTNDQPALDERVTRLHFRNHKEPQVSYSLTAFHAGPKMRVSCQVRDLGDGQLRATG